MAFPTGTIRLEAARAIFTGVEFEEIRFSDEVSGYRAILQDGTKIERKALTQLCNDVWEMVAKSVTVASVN